jgi:hypothetical protein
MSPPRQKNPEDNEINITQHEFSVKKLDRTCFLTKNFDFSIFVWHLGKSFQQASKTPRGP